MASNPAYESEERTFAPADRTFAAGHADQLQHSGSGGAAHALVFTLTEIGRQHAGRAINTFTDGKIGLELEDGSQSQCVRRHGARGDLYGSLPGPTRTRIREMPGFQVTYDSEHALRPRPSPCRR